MSKEVKNSATSETHNYPRLTTILIIFISAMSLITAFLTINIQSKVNFYNDQSEKFSNIAILAENDISQTLGHDSTYFQTAYNLYIELLALNAQIKALKQYNETHFNVTQEEIDRLALEFALKMEQMTYTVYSTYVYTYTNQWLHTNATNNYTYLGTEYHYITNFWVKDPDLFDIDVKQWVTTWFSGSSVPPELPVINYESWEFDLYYNLSILSCVGAHKAIEYIEVTDMELKIVNLSLFFVIKYDDGYSFLADSTTQTGELLSTVLIAFAIAAVILGFSGAMEKKKYRKINLMIGIVLVILSLVFFFIAVLNILEIPRNEAIMIGTIVY